MNDLQLRPDSPAGGPLKRLLEEHLEHMLRITPAGSVHAFDPEGTAVADADFWSAWHGDHLVGCGALRAIDAGRGEIKAMRTVAAWRGRGVGSAVLRCLLDEAARRGYREVLLETGALPEFAGTRAFYRRHGFAERGPFGDYVEDPNSVFMALSLK